MKKLFLKAGTFVLTALLSCGWLAGCTNGNKNKNPNSGTTKTIENVSADDVTTLAGREVVLQIENLQEGDKVYYSKDNKTFSETPVVFAEAGTHTLYYKVTRKGYKDFVASVQIEAVAVQSLFSLEGDTLTFGKYPRSLLTASGETKKETVTATPYDSVTLNGVEIAIGEEYDFAVEKVTWTVVESTEGGYVAVSNEIIDVTAYHSEYVSVDFAAALIKAKVATVYEAMFTDLERQACTVDVLDKQFIADLGEKADGVLQAKASDYAIARGLWTSDLLGYIGNGAYWLKDAGTDARYAKFVDFNGLINEDGYMVHAPYFGIRLVLKITL